MWMFVVIVALLGQNQAAPFPGNISSILLILQQQAQTTASAVPVFTQQQTASSSSSSSSSDTSESSQSSEGPQQLRERQNLENTAVEQIASSQESTEVLQAPGNRTSSLWLSELVALGQRVERRDDSVETGQHRAQTLTLLLTQPRSRDMGLSPRDNGSTETVPAGGRAAPPAGTDTEDGAAAERNWVRHDEDEFLHLLDDSAEKADGQMFDLLGRRGYHGNEAGLELGL